MGTNLGPSKSQSATYEAVGTAEDFSPIITNIDPESTYFLSNFTEDKDATNIKFGWFTEGLNPPRQNAHVEMAKYESGKVGSIEGKENVCQHFINSGRVSDAERKVKKMYTPEDEFNRQMQKAFQDQANDMEYMIVNGDLQRLGTETVPALSGGIPYFMQTESIKVTFGASNKVTAASKHNLRTGDFIYLQGEKLPVELSSNIIYYLRADETSSETVFTLHDTQKSAVEGGTAVTFTAISDASNVMIKNNVISLEGKNDYSIDDINTVMQMCYRRGGHPTEAIMSGSKKKRFSSIAAAVNMTTRKQAEKTLQSVVTALDTDFGLINAKAHRMYPDNRVDLLDMNYWDLKWFDRTHEVKGIAKEGSYTDFVIEGWLGLKGTQPKASGSILNIKRG